MSENKRTEGKWSVEKEWKVIKSDISEDEDVSTVASFSWAGGEPVSENWLANAQFICRAVNSHDELVEACENLLKASSDYYVIATGETADLLEAAQAQARKAVSKAKGEGE